MDKAQLGQLVTDCLNSTPYISLATVDNNQPYSCTLLFAFDENLNFYFMSGVNTKHTQNISKNHKVALSLYKFNENPKGERIGVQIIGNAEIVSDNDLEKAFDTYFGRFGQDDNEIDEYKEGSEWRFYKIKPREIFYFDSNLNEEKVKVI